METAPQLALHYHQEMPERIHQYLNARGIADAAINHHLLGWNGERITIPIFNREGKLAYFKLAKDPEDPKRSAKMLTPAGSTAELFGWERVVAKPTRIIICEGEFDRLVLESQGLAAATSTGGAGVFRSEWAEAFAEIIEVYLCFDRDDAGRTGARRIAGMIPHARLVELPEEVGKGGDVTDFFVRLGRSREDLMLLLDSARPLRQSEVPESLPTESIPTNGEREVDRLKALVPIEEVVGRYAPLAQSGRAFVGLCPFHDDHRPSLAVYPDTQRFYCFGCRAHGDVIDFLMRHEHLNFPQTLDVLRKLAPPR